MKTISTPKAPAAIGPYSQAKVVNGMLYASGQIPINPATGDVDATTIEGQTEQVIANIAAVLEEASLQISLISEHSTEYTRNTSQANQLVHA